MGTNSFVGFSTTKTAASRGTALAVITAVFFLPRIGRISTNLKTSGVVIVAPSCLGCFHSIVRRSARAASNLLIM
jgi:hypothetical protein